MPFLFSRYNLGMTNEQILEKQVEALEKLLQLREAIIQELEAKVSKLQHPYPGLGNIPYYGGYGQPGISIPSVWTTPQGTLCTDGQAHTYPQNWGGTTSPPCTKCGQQTFPQSGVITTFAGAGGVAGQAGQTLVMGAAGPYWAPASSVTTTLSVDGLSQSVTTAAAPATPTVQNNVFTLTGTANK